MLSFKLRRLQPGIICQLISGCNTIGEFAKDASKTVENLLLNCARGHPGQSFLIVHEPTDEQFYDPALPEVVVVADKARDLGFAVDLQEIPFEKEVKDPSPELN